MTATEIPRWYTVPVAAKKAGVSEWLLRAEITDGRCRARRVRRLLRVLDSDLRDWMQGNGLESASAESTDEAGRSEATPGVAGS